MAEAIERILMSPTEAADVLRLSRSKTYELIRIGQLPSIRIGGVLRVPVDAVRERVARELAATGNGQAA